MKVSSCEDSIRKFEGRLRLNRSKNPLGANEEESVGLQGLALEHGGLQ